MDSPRGQRVEDKVTWAREILLRYDPDFLRLENDVLRHGAGDCR